jgi:hypothetical protein
VENYYKENELQTEVFWENDEEVKIEKECYVCMTT